ncbi:MAG TPA: hypothetical protein VFT77_09510 [Reyranella sp.]|jgi:hypothetical protein|nr:hypothetical protein [Reyranella sp.]
MAVGGDSEYVPDLGTNPATVQMYDRYFVGPSGALLKARIADAARRVGLNPGLLAASLFAEHGPASYTRRTGEVEGWVIGTDDYKERKADIERKVPAARALKPIRYDPHTNENGRVIPEVPVFKAEDAVLASAVYLKYAEEEIRRITASMGGSFDRLPVEYQFALARYGVNAGIGAARQRVMEFLGMTLHHGRYARDRGGKEFLQYKPGTLDHGVERFSRHHPQRAATAHAAQAIHLSQKIFGIDPAGHGDSLLFIR